MRTPGTITDCYDLRDRECADLAEMIPLEIGNLALSNPPDWGLALGVSAGGLAARNLSARESSGARVRGFTRSVMDQWGVVTGAEAAVIVAWELAANAVQHALRVEEPPGTRHSAWLGLVRRGDAVVCAVTDSSLMPPRLRSPGLTSCGRGLHVVNRISSHWGWSLSSSGTKTVWARVPAAW